MGERWVRGLDATQTLQAVCRYWKQKAWEVKCPHLIIIGKIFQQAIVDALESPRDFDRNGNSRIRYDGGRKTAYWVLFADDPEALSLRWFCDLVGPEVEWVRATILEAALDHGMIYMDDPWRRPEPLKKGDGDEYEPDDDGTSATDADGSDGDARGTGSAAA